MKSVYGMLLEKTNDTYIADRIYKEHIKYNFNEVLQLLLTANCFSEHKTKNGVLIKY